MLIIFCWFYQLKNNWFLPNKNLIVKINNYEENILTSVYKTHYNDIGK